MHAAEAPLASQSVYRKVALRLIPFLFLCYILAYLDRVNVGFAKLQMGTDLGLSDTVYGMGAGIFFIGYFFLEVPSNLMLTRVGARRWIARIMILWGLISAGTMFIEGRTSFYALRFLLGAAEAGFFPGIILYLTYWFPREYRARMVACFMTAIPLAGVLGGPLSGGILKAMAGVATLRGWQWLYLIEGLMPLLAGLGVLRFLDDGPASAAWLSPAEKALVLDQTRGDGEGAAPASTFRDAFASGKVWLLAAIYFCLVMGLYGISFWLPQILEESLTRDSLQIGLLSAIPWSVAAVAMVLHGLHSDRTGERRWHVALACLASAAAYAACGLLGANAWLRFLALILVAASTLAALSCFWTLPTNLLTGTAAAVGIAWINSFGNLAGYVSPWAIGMIRDATHRNMGLALGLTAVFMAAAAVLVLAVTRPEGRATTSRPR